jgi:hypothetical protein
MGGRFSVPKSDIDIGLTGMAVSFPGEATGIAFGRDNRYFNAFNQISCLSLVGAVIFISLCAVETMTLYW